MKKKTIGKDGTTLKFGFSKRQRSWVLGACLVVAFTVICVFIGVRWDSLNADVRRIIKIFDPVIIGLVIAYLLNPILKLCEKYVFRFVEHKKPRKKLKRGLSLALTYLVLIVAVYVFVSMIIPQVNTSFNDLKNNLQSYLASAEKWINNAVDKSEFLQPVMEMLEDFVDFEEIQDKFNGLISDLFNMASSAIPQVISFLSGFVTSLTDFIVGIFISIYLLISKDKLFAQVKKLMYAFLSTERREKVMSYARFIDKTFGGYITGKLLDSLIVGLCCYIMMTILNMPYAIFISMINAVASLVPFFGPIIGAIPSTLIIFIVSPKQGLIFLVMILVLQQIDGNVIEPKILGESTGISALWVIVSITIMGGLFGVVGMLIGVPAFAVIYDLVKRAGEKRLKKKELPLDTIEYGNE